MKKFILILLIMVFGVLKANADIQPWNAADVPKGVIGLYQTNNSLKVFQKADLKSPVVYESSWNYKSPDNISVDNIFAVLLQNKELSYLYVTDVDENWVEVLYDKKNNLKGWVPKEDEFQFLPWISFYNLYGKKYGLRILRDTPDSIKSLFSASDENSQLLGKVNVPKTIRLTAIKGNWALVSVLDVDKIPKTGFIRWRSTDGEIYIFPDIK